MNSYFETENPTKRRDIIQIVLLVLILIVVSYQTVSKEVVNYQLKNDKALQAGESIDEFCRISIQSIINGNITSLSYGEETFTTLKNNPNALNFSDTETIKAVKTGKDQCLVITSSGYTQRGFLLTLNSSIANPLFYKITHIHEQEVDDSEKVNAGEKQ